MKQRATVMVERDGHVLLVARAGGRWAFPGGRAKSGEALADAASRELREETGLEAISVRYVFQFKGLRTRHFVFVATVRAGTEPLPSNEIERCRWLRPEDFRRIEASIPTKGIADIFLKQMHGGRGKLLKEAINMMVA
jgi:8-oxo-dGTP diphosphatase